MILKNKKLMKKISIIITDIITMNKMKINIQIIDIMILKIILIIRKM
jgi:hypothetical protein